ncbi:hypothetical protein KFK09_020798 [Dendrobium nobile]|uniref:Uncharacterized protein n=1 Tax=Dendrobium nobile TaxID=94219 RepID=A0A8T3AMV1_DENNO|nr:hypothetical protein KFK09_020798 [Dendrobium nobile]
MAKTKALRFATEVAPPQLVSVVKKKKVSKLMETIVEEERDNAISSSSSSCKSSSSAFGKEHDKALSDLFFLSWLPKKLV